VISWKKEASTESNPSRSIASVGITKEFSISALNFKGNILFGEILSQDEVGSHQNILKPF